MPRRAIACPVQSSAIVHKHATEKWVAEIAVTTRGTRPSQRMFARFFNRVRATDSAMKQTFRVSQR